MELRKALNETATPGPAGEMPTGLGRHAASVQKCFGTAPGAPKVVPRRQSAVRGNLQQHVHKQARGVMFVLKYSYAARELSRRPACAVPRYTAGGKEQRAYGQTALLYDAGRPTFR